MAIIKSYKEQRDKLREMFENDKTGDQTLFADQAKLFKPLIESQKETSRAIQDKIVAGQDATSNALIPFTRELQRRNDQVEALQNLPFYNLPPEIESVPQSTPQRDIIAVVNLDAGLNVSDIENLEALGLELPSIVQKNGTIEETLKKIKTKNQSIGQLLGKGSKKTAMEKEMYESQKKTLVTYKESISALEGAKKFTKKLGEGLRERKLVKQKRGRGRPRKYPDAIIYKNPDELCVKLAECIAAKQSGNTGVVNVINSILEELLKIKAIDKDEYNNLYKNIFN